MNDGDEELVATRAGVRALLAHIDEVVICCDEYGTVRFVNEAFQTLLGYSPELFVGRNIVEIVHPEELDDVVAAIARWEGRSGVPRGEPVTVRTVDGSWVKVRYDAAVGPDFGTVGSLIITLRPEATLDLAERELRARVVNDDRIIRLSSVFLNLSSDDFEDGLQAAVSELATLEDVTRVSVWRTDGDRIHRRASWAAAVGEPRLALPPRMRISSFVSLRRAAEGDDTFLRKPWTLGPEYEPERRLFEKAGTAASMIAPMMAGDEFVGIVWIESTVKPDFGATHHAALRSACAILAEAFLRNEVERSLATQALTDRVTGMANRWAFDVELECALDDLTSGSLAGMALAIVDLDRFKNVNDTYGHAVGDRLLFDVAERLRAQPGDDVTLARLGGDEILVLFTDVAHADDALRRTEELLGALDRPFDLPGGAMTLTASAGVAFNVDGDTEMTELMNKADVAMYQVKSRGGDGVELADAHAHRQRSARLRLEHDLARTIAVDGLDVYFQPEFELLSGRLLGAEALVRWNHARYGLLAASEFITMAESGGMITVLGRQVLTRACRIATPWSERLGPDRFLLRVNVAAQQLRQVDFVQQVADVLDDTGFPADSLCLELTESTLLSDPSVASHRFGELRRLGVGLAVDDFGTGYSSYLQLRSLPLTALKIDRSFVTDLPTSSTDGAIVAATLDLAKALGLDATAEGVETDAQLAALIRLGCRSAQGYLLGRPMPAESFETLIEDAA